jgi:hypothetical protein
MEVELTQDCSTQARLLIDSARDCSSQSTVATLGPSVRLCAGTYRMRPVSGAAHFWGEPTCGWLWAARVHVQATGQVSTLRSPTGTCSSGTHVSEQAAFDAMSGRSLLFSVPRGGSPVWLYVADSPCEDNSGRMEVEIAQECVASGRVALDHRKDCSSQGAQPTIGRVLQLCPGSYRMRAVRGAGHSGADPSCGWSWSAHARVEATGQGASLSTLGGPCPLETYPSEAQAFQALGGQQVTFTVPTGGSAVRFFSSDTDCQDNSGRMEVEFVRQ